MATKLLTINSNIDVLNISRSAGDLTISTSGASSNIVFNPNNEINMSSKNLAGVGNITAVNCTLTGNLTVTGTTTTINTTNLNIKDNNIALNVGGTDDTSKGAGIDINTSWSSGYIRSDVNGTKYVLKAPLNAYVLWTPVLTADSTIALSNNINGTANYVRINDGWGNLSEEQYLSQTRGGLGLNVTLLSSGFLIYNWTTHLFSIDPSITNFSVAENAAIARTKLATGTANYFVVNDGVGNLSESPLVTINWTNVVVGTAQSDKLKLNATLQFGSGSKDIETIYTVTTTDATATNIHSITCSVNDSYAISLLVEGHNTTDNDSCCFSYQLIKIYHTTLGNNPVVNHLNKAEIKDNVNYNFDYVLSANTVAFKVTGLASKTVNWTLKLLQIGH